jgi:hypothetical protein
MTAPFLEREMSKFRSRNASFMVQKMPNLWHALHFMDPFELPTLEYVSPEFTRKFGWDMNGVESLNLSIMPMIDEVRLSPTAHFHVNVCKNVCELIVVSVCPSFN